jgi:hypothetical protein
MSPALPVPIVRRAPAAGLFGRKGKAPAAGKRGTIRVFPWEQLLLAADPADAVPVVVRFPIVKS